MTAKQIITQYLKSHGYDGLWTFDCGCELQDLGPCGSIGLGCEPGYKKIVRDPNIPDDDNNQDYDFVIGPKR